MFTCGLAPMRYLTVLGFLGLMAGCTKPCLLPGELSDDPARSCYYQLMITHIDMDRYLVMGKLPDVLIERHSGEKIEAPEKTTQEFAFRVRDLDKLGKQLAIKKTYEFVGQGNSVYLELLPGEPR